MIEPVLFQLLKPGGHDEQTRKALRVKTTKNKRSRVITLPASLVELLRFLYERQQENRRMFDADYRTDLDLVFAASNGEYLKPNSVPAKACLIAKKAGFSNVGIHSLRHSHGSQTLSKGVPLTTVSKRLGHSNVYTTATIYAHALPKDAAAAAELWDREFEASPVQAIADFLQHLLE
jgi:integrase